MVNCSDEFPFTETVYEEITGDIPIITALVISCFLTFVSICIFLEGVVFLLNNHHDDSSQINSKLVLTSLYPVTSSLALIALLVPRSTILVDLLASCYLSVCVFVFVAMIISLFGGDGAMLRELKEERVKMNTPPCCCCCCCILKPITLTRSSLRKIKLLTLQGIILDPLLLFISAVMWTDRKYEQQFSPTSGYSYISGFSAISTMLSIYGLMIIYHGSRSKLQHYKISLKFHPLNLCFILVSLQSAVFNALAERDIPGCNGSRGPRVRAAAINHALLIIEMLLLSILARFGYRRVENKDSIDGNSVNNEDRGRLDNNYEKEKFGSQTDL